METNENTERTKQTRKGSTVKGRTGVVWTERIYVGGESIRVIS